METISVTKLEKQFIDALIKNLYAEEGFSDVGCAEIALQMGIKVNVAKGVLGSLVKKNLAFVDEDGRDIVYLGLGLHNLHPDAEWNEGYLCKGHKQFQLSVSES